MRPLLKHRDLLRLVVLLIVVRALVDVVTTATGGSPLRPARHSLRGAAALASDLEPAGRDLTRSLPAGTGSAPPVGQSADSGSRRRRTRRGRRAPSAKRRGSRGARHRAWSGCRPAAGAGLIIGVLNIQSIKPKLLELTDQLHRGKYDLMCLAETWLKTSTPNRLLVLPGYQLHRADRPDNRGYGGVALAVRHGISASSIKMPPTTVPGSRLESLWTLVRVGQRRQFVLCVAYRPPRRSVADLNADFGELEAQYQHVSVTYPGCKMFICGDLNCCWLKPDSTPAKRALCTFTSDNALTQCVESPTYFTGSSLDVFITSCRSVVKTCFTKVCHFSTHKFVRAIIDMPRFKSPCTRVRTRCLRRVDVTHLHADLTRSDWSGVFSASTVTEKWDCFLDVFLPVMDAHAPIKSVRIRNPSAPPVSDATKALMCRRRGALAEYGHGSTEYRDANRAVRAAIRRDSRDDVTRRIRENGRGAMWKVLRSFVSSKRHSGQRPTTSADDLNTYFVSVGPRVAEEVAGLGGVSEVACRLPRVGACALQLSPLSLEDLRSVIFGLSSSSACGDDGISIHMFRMSFDSIGEVILHLVNSSITQSDVPSSWKHSLVHPILKSGDPSDPSNFRPISLVPIISKILERAVHQQLYAYLSENHLLSPNQHGFRPRHSTETALTSLSDHILSSFDHGEVSLLCLLDLTKCFDVIDHSRLLSKLQAHGIDTSWFSAYLKGHTQSVRFTGALGEVKTSRPLPNNIGVFQGSCLGPLLYCVFANDLGQFAQDAVVIQYADDTQILVSGKKTQLQTVVARMEHVLSSLDSWFRSNGLKVNAAKTQLMLLGSPQNLRSLPDIKVVFRDHQLLPISEAKNLGLVFDRSLSWTAHVSSVTRRCFGVLSGLSHLRGCLPSSVILTLVNALVISQVRYCISVYGGTSKQNLSRVQKVLNYAAKVVFGRKKYDHASDLLARLGWLNAEQLASFHALSLLHKVRCSGEPEVIATGITTVAEARGCDLDVVTRQDHLLHVPRCRTEMGRRRFQCRGPASYNTLPPDLPRLPPHLFGRRLRRHLCDSGSAPV